MLNNPGIGGENIESDGALGGVKMKAKAEGSEVKSEDFAKVGMDRR